MAEFVDAMGIPLADHHRWLPDRVSLWPTPKKIVDKEAAWKWKERHQYGGCWWCDKGRWTSTRDRMECHHMARHDAPWAFSLLCSDCHRHTEAAVHAASLPRMLRLKWEYDRANTSWVHLAIGLGRFLPLEE